MGGTVKALVNARLPLTDDGKGLWTMALDGDRIKAVVPQRDWVSPEGRGVLDVRGKPVLPGFVDAHMHPLSLGLKRMRLNLAGVKSLRELLSAVQEAARRHRSSRWVIGYDWDESFFTDERRYPNRWDLDKVAPDIPVALRRIDGHLWVVNTKALSQMKLSADNPFVLKTGGDPNGLLADEALRFLEPFVTPTLDEKREALRRAEETALEQGVTTLADLLADFSIYEAAVSEKALAVRFVCAVPPETAQRLEQPLPWRIDREKCTVRFVKLFLDGSIGARTAALRMPYSDAPDETGRLLLRDRALEGLMLDLTGKGWLLAVHAIGDLAIDQAIEAFRCVRQEGRSFHRHRLEHVELLHPGHLGWMRELNLVASMQPNFVVRWQHPQGLYGTRLGWERAKRMNPFRSVREAKVPLAFGSDGMPFGPLYGLLGALTHPDEKERLTLREALIAYTQGAAFACALETELGTIAPGKLADLLVLSFLPDETAFCDEWERIKIETVLVGGEVVWQCPGGE